MLGHLDLLIACFTNRLGISHTRDLRLSVMLDDGLELWLGSPTYASDFISFCFSSFLFVVVPIPKYSYLCSRGLVVAQCEI